MRAHLICLPEMAAIVRSQDVEDLPQPEAQQTGGGRAHLDAAQIKASGLVHALGECVVDALEVGDHRPNLKLSRRRHECLRCAEATFRGWFEKALEPAAKSAVTERPLCQHTTGSGSS